jgi:HisJ family histidinol phosphate phosphatase
LNDNIERDPRLYAIPDTHGHAKGEHKPYVEERPLPLTARMLFLWFYHACRRGFPRFLMVADHMNYLTFEDPAAVNLVRRALKLAQAGDLYGAAETANVDVGHAAVVSEGLRRGMRYSIGAEVDNDPRSRPDAQNIVDAMRPDGIIRSVHFVPITHPVHGENWPWPFDNPEFADLFDVIGTEQTWELYVTTLVDAIERLPGHIVGHFFVPAVFGHWPDDAKLSEYEDRVLAAAEARGMAIEFNTRFFYREHDDSQKDRYLAANMRLLRKARDRGVAIAIGADAHSPKDQGGAFDVVLQVLDALDINEIVFPMGGVLRRVALRVVREPDPEPVPEPVPEPPPAVEAAAEPKPIRKARAAAKATRPPQTSPDRPPERPETAAQLTPPPAPLDEISELPPEPPADPPAYPEVEPAAAKKAVKKKSAASPPPVDAAPAKSPKPAASKPAPAPAPVKAAAKAAPAKAVPVKAVPVKAVPVKAVPVKAVPAKAVPAKAAPAKAAPAKPAAKAASAKAPSKAAASARHAPKAPAKKAVAAKPVAKKANPARPAASKASAGRPGSKKAVPAKKAPAAKKPVAKKPAPARAVAKKAAPKKGAVKKAPARGAPARKTTTKKTTAKKTAKRR